MECSSASVANDECEGCKQPFWCTDHGINRGDDWIDAYFYDEDKDFRQCRWRPSELEQMIDASMEVYKRRWDFFYWGDWNEVNVYVGPGNGGVHTTFFETLVALVVWRFEGADTLEAVSQMKSLQRHLCALGKRVPIISVDPVLVNEDGETDKWSAGTSKPLLNSGWPYYMELIQDADCP